ncbi:MAG: ComF family protein [Kiritimatiellae bacterium]|nr:ComF family protein [Kiritimatiellia bacterium]
MIERGKTVLDILYPRTCEGCGSGLRDAGDGQYLCWECMAQASIIQPPYCIRCGQPVTGMIDHDYCCHACMRKPPFFDIARSCVLHEGVMREILMTFKYRDGLWLTRDLLRFMSACLSCDFNVPSADGFIFVPMHHQKKRERGFNQAELLARGLAKTFHKPLYTRFLKRNRLTSTQTKLTANQRRSNVQGVFSTRWARWLEGKWLILIDDVMTTGATANECARTLKKAGAARVDVLTFARGAL